MRPAGGQKKALGWKRGNTDRLKALRLAKETEKHKSKHQN
jgi:hypothetical protein